jgi:hypothetical protein
MIVSSPSPKSATMRREPPSPDVTTERSEFGIGQSAGLDLRDPALADVHDLCELALGRGLFLADLREAVRADLSDDALSWPPRGVPGSWHRRQRRHASRPTTFGPSASSRSFALLFLDPLARSDTRRSGSSCRTRALQFPALSPATRSTAWRFARRRTESGSGWRRASV